MKTKIQFLPEHPRITVAPLLSNVLREVSVCLRAPGYLLLLFTPGAWITFGLRLQNLSFWARLFTAAMLSPLVVLLEFYALRSAGLAFGPTAVALVVMNLPAMYLIWKCWLRTGGLHPGDWIAGAAVILLPLACMIPLLTNQDARVFSPHGWYHADAAYMFARGNLILEDPTLAGIRLSYPVWTPLVLPAVQSFLVDSPPVSSYAWSNLFWLIAFCCFATGITRAMGGGRLAQASAGIWFLLGTHPVGYIVTRFVPGFVDSRYTDGSTKFQLSGPMALALGMLIAMTWLMVRPGRPGKGLLAVIFLLLSGIGLLYPLLFPPACGILGAHAVAPLFGRENYQRSLLYREWAIWAVLVSVAALLTYAEVRFLTADRRVLASPVFFLPSRHLAAGKALAALIVTSPFLAGLAFTFRRCWEARRTATATLLGGAAASYGLYIAFNIPFYANEYKFIFGVAICLAVFPALAIERIWREWPRAWAAPVVVGSIAVLLGTYVHDTYRNGPSAWATNTPAYHQKRPLLLTDAFYLRLDPREPWAGICDAVQAKTPGNSVLVLNDGTYYYPGLTARSLYVSASDRDYSGMNIGADSLDADLRGYGRQVLRERRATIADFFDAADGSRREQALDAILALKRPVAIIAEPRHAALLQWLEHRSGAAKLYGRDGLSLWLIDEGRPRERRAGSTSGAGAF